MQRPEVNINPTPIYNGDTITVDYNGLLAKSGAEQVYLHAGTTNGNDNQWNNVQDIEMNPKQDGSWRIQLQVENGDAFSFCFKDCANNWDNNSGHNWTQEIY
ncbi:carbohydrate-binding protein [Halanaerobaculum tunisiense]